MKPTLKAPPANEEFLALPDFMKSYNKTIPEGFPRASAALLNRFKEQNALFFKHGELWSLHLHRKRIMDWLPQNSKI